MKIKKIKNLLLHEAYYCRISVRNNVGDTPLHLLILSPALRHQPSALQALVNRAQKVTKQHNMWHHHTTCSYIPYTFLFQLKVGVRELYKKGVILDF